MAGKDLGSTQSIVYFYFQMVQERPGTVTVVVLMRMAHRTICLDAWSLVGAIVWERSGVNLVGGSVLTGGVL